MEGTQMEETNEDVKSRIKSSLGTWETFGSEDFYIDDMEFQMELNWDV